MAKLQVCRVTFKCRISVFVQNETLANLIMSLSYGIFLKSDKFALNALIPNSNGIEGVILRFNFFMSCLFLEADSDALPAFLEAILK